MTNTSIACKICGTPSELAFSAQILRKFTENFYTCAHCGFLSCGEAHWLPQAYQNPINISDTGIVARNLHLYKIVSCIATLLFDFKATKSVGGGAR